MNNNFNNIESFFSIPETSTQRVESLSGRGIDVFLKREYENHQFISGNKFRKLKYNLIEARKQNKKVILTFGGAFSNHIAATAYAGNLFGIKTIGIIRGEELKNNKLNSTLEFAKQHNIVLDFVNRTEYRKKQTSLFIKTLKDKYGDFYLIPEGGDNILGFKGCKEILTKQDNTFDYVCCPLGTGTTLLGLIDSSHKAQTILGFSALKDPFVEKNIDARTIKKNWVCFFDNTFGGYAKTNNNLIDFINLFYQENNILLDPIYTGKMVFKISELLKKGYFSPPKKILIIHTGGLQGILGMNHFLEKKGLRTICT